MAYNRINWQYLRLPVLAILLRRRGLLLYFLFSILRLTTVTCNYFGVGVRFIFFYTRLYVRCWTSSPYFRTTKSGGRCWWTCRTCACYVSDMPTSSCQPHCMCKFYLLLTDHSHCIVCFDSLDYLIYYTCFATHALFLTWKSQETVLWRLNRLQLIFWRECAFTRIRDWRENQIWQGRSLMVHSPHRGHWSNVL